MLGLNTTENSVIFIPFYKKEKDQNDWSISLMSYNK